MLLSSSPFVCSSALFISLFLLLVFAPRFFPVRYKQSPIPLQDELEDIHLFHQATAASSRKISHLEITNPKPKIAFLFLINSDVHADPSAKIGGGILRLVLGGDRRFFMEADVKVNE